MSTHRNNPIKYTMQTFISGYSLPDGDDVTHHRTKQACNTQLRYEHDEAYNYGAAYGPSEAFVWLGKLDDVTDVYPDFIITMGPNGGTHWRNA
jgi:hypothetical protein